MPLRLSVIALLLVAVPASASDPAMETAACVSEAALVGRRDPPGSFDETIAALERCAERAPRDAALRVRLARMVWRKVHEDAALPAPRRKEYVAAALGHADKALGLDADNYEAVVLKGVLTVLTAEDTTDAARRKALLDEAASLKKRALALKDAGVEPRPDPYELLFAPKASPAPGAPIPVGGVIKEPKKIKRVNPRYPESMREARVQGVVVLEAVIDVHGKVESVRVVRGVHPILDRDAMEAVRRWEYTTTLLDGKPVPVLMTIAVNYRLN